MLTVKLVRNLLINRDFGLLLIGRLVSQIGDGIHYFAVAWLVLDITGSGVALGTLLMVASIPGIILTPVSGVLADMLDRKSIIVAMDIVRGLLLLVLAGIYAAGWLSIPVLYVATIVLSLCGVLFGPAVVATIPGLVKREELVKANARDGFSHSATGILGPILGAFLLARYGYLGIFLVNGFSFLISAMLELLICFPTIENARSQAEKPIVHFTENLKEGFNYLLSNPGLRVIILGGVILNFLFSPLFGVVLPYFGKEVLLMTPEYYGISQAALPVGMLLGTVLVGITVQKLGRTRLLVGGVALQGGIMMSLGMLALPRVFSQASAVTTLIAMVVPLFLMGIVNVHINVPLNVMMQETVPENYRGRVFSLFGCIMNVAAPLGMGLVGVLLDIVPLQFLFPFCGGVVAVMALALGTSSSLHQLCAGTTKATASIEDVSLVDR